jgi:3D (Asp-Asp-Asp) domain-containing protein
MKKNLKPPLLGQKTTILLTGIGIIVILSFLLVLKPIVLSAESNSEVSGTETLKEKMIILQENTLASISTPPIFDPSKIQKVRVILTGYSSTPEETDDTPFITASGSRVKDGIVANNYFSFGTEVRIPQVFGDKVFIVKDRMHWTKSNYHFDIWFPEKEKALEFGVKETYIEILDN